MIEDIIYFTVGFFVVVLSVVIAYMIMGGINDAIQDNDQMSTLAKTTMQTQTTKFSTVWDYSLLVVYFAIVAGLLAIAYVLPTNPVVVFATIIIIAVLGAFSGYLANSWIETSTAGDSFGAAAASFPVSGFILTHYLEFTIGMCFLVLIVFYAKPNPEGAF